MTSVDTRNRLILILCVVERALNEIVFLVEDDPEGGYTARALGESIFTEAETEEELRASIVDALRCHFEKESEIPRIIRLHFVREHIFTYA